LPGRAPGIANVGGNLERWRCPTEALARAGADFVALGDFAWSDPRGLAATIATAARLLTPEPVR